MQIWSSCPPREKLQGSHTLRLLPIFIVKLNKLSIATTEPPCGSCEITGMDWGFGAARVKWSKEKAGADQTLAWKLQETCWKAPWEWRGQNGETSKERQEKRRRKQNIKSESRYRKCSTTFAVGQRKSSPDPQKRSDGRCDRNTGEANTIFQVREILFSWEEIVK